MPATADTVADTMPSAAFLLWLAYWNTEVAAVQSPDVRLRRAFGTNVNVLTQFAGTFVPSKKCPAPRVLLYLCGHVRTWNITAASHFQMLERSSPGCWFVVAALPHKMTQQRATIPKTFSRNYRKYWQHQLNNVNTFAKYRYSNATVAETLKQMELLFGSRLAHAVVDRNTSLDAAENGYPLMWALPSMVADWAFNVVHQAPLAWETIVIRTRPDVKTPLVINDIALAQRYLRTRSLRGTHLIWGTEGVHTDCNHSCSSSQKTCRGQSPQFLVTSYGAYVSDIAVPIEIGSPWRQHDVSPERAELYAMGTHNGWGYGRSMPCKNIIFFSSRLASDM